MSTRFRGYGQLVRPWGAVQVMLCRLALLSAVQARPDIGLALLSAVQAEQVV